MPIDVSAGFENFAASWLPAVEEALERYLPQSDGLGARLHRAMRYSVQAGGKRLRPLLVLAGAHDATGGAIEPREGLLRAAAAVEMIHTYSLIHDDLPAMDNDDLRRGRPTCHRQFDEATAILAGDALNTLAFAVLAAIDDAPPSSVLQAIADLADGAGAHGMVLGQQADMELQGRAYTAAELRFVHVHKTARLLAAATRIGARLAGAAVGEVELLGRFGLTLGLAFQVVDDILDVESDTATLGKTAGKDAAAGKATYPALLGLAEAKRIAQALHDEALAMLAPLGARASMLPALLHRVVHRAA